MPIPHSGSVFDNAENSEDEFLDKLRNLGKKSRRKRKQETLQEKVLKWYSALKEAQENGYTYEELAEIIYQEQGIQISAGTLRKYMTFAKHQQSEAKAAFSQVSNQPAPNPSSFPTFSARSHRETKKLSSERRASLTGQRTETDEIESEFENL